MKDVSVIFYTNNVLAKSLFDYTFHHCIEHCRLNQCELIIISHYPLTEQYDTCYMDTKPKFVQTVNPEDGTETSSPIYDMIIEERYPIHGVDYRAFVVGKMEYGALSTMKQVRLGIDRAWNDNIVLMEQDCLYPYNYIETCRRSLAVKDVAYILNNRIMLNMDGFFPGTNSIYLGSMAFRKKILKDDLDFKIETWAGKDLTVEPVPIGFPCKPDDRTYDAYCMDSDMGENNAIMDIKHMLNVCGYFIPQEYSDIHSYWGKADKYIDMFKDIKLPKKNTWGYGIAGY
jgi:hypothetical protein